MYAVIVKILCHELLVVMAVVYVALNVWRLRHNLLVMSPTPIRVIKIGAGMMVAFYYITIMTGYGRTDHTVTVAMSRMGIFMLLAGDILTHLWVLYWISTRKIRYG